MIRNDFFLLKVNSEVKTDYTCAIHLQWNFVHGQDPMQCHYIHTFHIPASKKTLGPPSMSPNRIVSPSLHFQSVPSLTLEISILPKRFPTMLNWLNLLSYNIHSCHPFRCRYNGTIHSPSLCICTVTISNILASFTPPSFKSGLRSRSLAIFL